jgi:hypothetical protein
VSTIVVAAAGGNSNVGATYVGGVAPTAADDVQLNATSGNLTIAANFPCRSLDCTGYTGTLTHNAGFAIQQGDATAGLSNIGIKFVAGMTYTLGSATTSSISLNSTAATPQTLDWGGKTTGSLTINGTAPQFTSAHTQSSSASVTLASSTAFDTNSQTCSWGTFTNITNGTRTLTMGSSAITITGTGTAWNTSGIITNFTITANTATITMTGAGATFAGASKNWNGMTLVMSGSGTPSISGANTFANLTRTGTAVKTDSFSLQANQTVTGILTLNSNSAVNRLLVQSSTLGTARTITAASVVVSNIVDFMDITGSGAATWTEAGTGATALGDAGGNSGITFSTPTTQTATTTGGNWSAITWSGRIPLPQDDVTLTGTLSSSITADMPRLGRTIDLSGVTAAGFNLSMATTNSIFGGLTMASSFGGVTGSGSLRFAGRSSYNVTMNSVQVTATSGVGLYAPGSTYTQQDAFTTTNTFDFNFGGWVTNTKAWSISVLASNITNARTMDISNSAVSLTSTAAATIWQFNATNGTIISTGSTISISNVSANTRTFVGAALTYGILQYTVAGSTGQLTITGSNSFQDIQFSDATNARSLVLTSVTTTTIRSTHGLQSLFGTSGKLMTVKSATAASPATIDFPNGYGGGSDWLSVQDITATTNTWYAGANSTNVSGNTNVTFTAPPAATSTSSNLLTMGIS